MNDEHKMSFLGHLDELRKRLRNALIGLVIGTAVAYFFFPQIMEFIKWPLPLEHRSIPLYSWGFMSVFMIRFKLAVIAGFMFASPLVIYEILAFLTPALKRNERRYVLALLPFLVLLFFGGVAFAFFLIVPPAIMWLESQGAGQLRLILRAEDYINFVSLFMLAFGVAFETPLVIIMLIKLGIVSRETLRKQWRIAYVASFIIAAMATPDWSIPPMLILGAALVVLFEVSLLVSRWL